MFNVLEERPIEPIVYEEIEIIESCHDDEQRKKQLYQPPAARVRCGGGESGSNLSVMEVCRS